MIRELIVRIKTVFGSTSSSAVADPIKQLTVDTEKLGQQTAKADTAGRQQAQTMKQQAQEIQRLQGGLRGGTTAFMGMTGAVGKLMAALGIVTAVYGTFRAAWSQGLKAQAFLWDKLVTSVKDMGPPIAKTKEEFAKLNEVKLAGLNKEVDGITTKLAATLSLLDKVDARNAKLRAAQAAVEDALIEARLPAGEERDKALAQAKTKREINELMAERESMQERIKESTAAGQALQAQRVERLRPIEEAQKRYEATRGRAEQRVARFKADEAQRGAETTGMSAALDEMNPEYRRRSPAPERSMSGAIFRPLKEARNQLAQAKKDFQPAIDELDKKRAELQQQTLDAIADMEALEARLAAARLRSGPTSSRIEWAEKEKKDLRALLRIQSQQREGPLAVEAARAVIDSPKGPAVGGDEKAAAVDALRQRLGLEEADVRRAEAKRDVAPGSTAVQTVLSKERQDVVAVEKAIQQVLGGNQETLHRIVAYLQTLDADNKQMKDQIRRLPL